MLQKWKDRLIEECREWWKLWSSWLAVLWGMIVTVFWNDPTLLSQVTAVLPDDVRAVLSPLVLGIVAGLPIFIRLLKQNINKPSVPDNQDQDKN